MSEHIFTLATWTRDVVHDLPRDLQFDDDALFDQVIDPNQHDIEAFFQALTREEAEALGEACLAVIAQCEIDDLSGPADEVPAIVAEMPRQQLSSVSETILVTGAAIFAILIACRLRGTKVGPDGTREISFYPGLPKGATDILMRLLDKISVGRIIDRLRKTENDSDREKGQADEMGNGPKT